MSSEKPADSSAPLVEARLAQVLARIARQLTDDQQTQVRKRIGRSVELAEKVRSTPLTNADEPEIVFQPYRRQERGS